MFCAHATRAKISTCLPQQSKLTLRSEFFKRDLLTKTYDFKMAETIFGQIIVGPPGSGKSTYCKYICENLRQLGRNAKIVNLDPANDNLLYKPAIDIRNLVNVETVMDKKKLGPNGAMIYCIEALNENYAWLHDQIVTLILDEFNKFKEAKDKGIELAQDKESYKNKPYILFDCPGQSEIYTHHTAMKDIIKKLTKRNDYFDLRLVCLNLCDSYHASDLGKYIGVVMNSLSTMLNLELPHVNILSKVDKIETYGKTRFNLDFYCELNNIKYLLETELESPFYKKYRDLTRAITDVIHDYALVTFVPLNIQQPEDILSVLRLADKANGYFIDDLDLSVLQLNPQLMEMASGRRMEPLNDATISQI